MIRYYRRRLGALGAVLAGAALSLGRMDAETRTRVLAVVLAWLADNWLAALPWLLAGVLFVLWRSAVLRGHAARMSADYWIEEAAERPAPRRQKVRTR